MNTPMPSREPAAPTPAAGASRARSTGKTVASIAGGNSDAPPTGDAPAAPAMFGRYRLLGRIGEGGMAEVYRAIMTGPEGFERELVLKRILPRLSDTGDFKTMFIREAKISALLMHPNIVQIYEFGEADGAYFIAMESVQGVTLREALTTLSREQRAMPHFVAADIARQICVGLDYAHTLSGADGVPLEIVHQDVSPTNIMLAYNGTVKVLDFGIARAASFAEEEAKKGLIKGKVSYLSPEQVHVRPFDARADVFALGVVFHEMLTGRRLFQAKNDITRMRQLLAQPIPLPSALNAAIPRELDRIVMKSLERDVRDRYASAADMASDLERTLIAARYSSRELSKLLHGLFLPDEDPLVVVDADDVQTVAGTATSAGQGAAGARVTRTGMTGTATGTSAGGATFSSGSGLTPFGPTTMAPGKLSSATGSQPGERGDGGAALAGSGPADRLSGVVRAERGRLARARFRDKTRVFAMAAVLLVAIAALGWAAKRFVPALFVRAAAPAPALETPLPNQIAPASAVKAPPTAKKRPARKRWRATSEAAPAAGGPMAPDDSAAAHSQ
jgi:serine/threonine protein kinase